MCVGLDTWDISNGILIRYESGLLDEEFCKKRLNLLTWEAHRFPSVKLDLWVDCLLEDEAFYVGNPINVSLLT